MTLEKIEQGAERLAMHGTGSGEDVRDLAGLVAGLARTQRVFMQTVHDGLCLSKPDLAEKVGAQMDGDSYGSWGQGSVPKTETRMEGASASGEPHGPITRTFQSLYDLPPYL